MKVAVKWKGKLLDPFEIGVDGKISLLKAKIEKITDVKAQNQKLLCKGKILQVRKLFFVHFIYSSVGRRFFDQLRSNTL
jgi:hypothetical protein